MDTNILITLFLLIPGESINFICTHRARPCESFVSRHITTTLIKQLIWFNDCEHEARLIGWERQSQRVERTNLLWSEEPRRKKVGLRCDGMARRAVISESSNEFQAFWGPLKTHSVSTPHATPSYLPTPTFGVWIISWQYFTRRER